MSSLINSQSLLLDHYLRLFPVSSSGSVRQLSQIFEMEAHPSAERGPVARQWPSSGRQAGPTALYWH